MVWNHSLPNYHSIKSARRTKIKRMIKITMTFPLKKLLSFINYTSLKRWYYHYQHQGMMMIITMMMIIHHQLIKKL